MVRMQIRLTEQQARTLKEIASQRGVPMAELIRQSIERLIEENQRRDKWRKAFAIMGRYRSGLKDISANHDKYLDEKNLW